MVGGGIVLPPLRQAVHLQPNLSEFSHTFAVMVLCLRWCRVVVLCVYSVRCPSCVLSRAEMATVYSGAHVCLMLGLKAYATSRTSQGPVV